MSKTVRISLDLWCMLNAIYFDDDLIIETEPDPYDYDVVRSQRDRERFARHRFYHESRYRSSKIAIAILSVACLESYANELSVLIPSLSEVQRSEIRRAGVRDKYQKLSTFLSGVTFQPNEDPFRSFQELVNLRNTLVHYKPVVQQDLDDDNDRELSFPEDLWDNFPRRAKAAVAGMLRSIRETVDNAEITLDPDVPADFVAKLWERRIRA